MTLKTVFFAIVTLFLASVLGLPTSLHRTAIYSTPTHYSLRNALTRKHVGKFDILHLDLKKNIESPSFFERKERNADDAPGFKNTG